MRRDGPFGDARRDGPFGDARSALRDLEFLCILDDELMPRSRLRSSSISSVDMFLWTWIGKRDIVKRKVLPFLPSENT